MQMGIKPTLTSQQLSANVSSWLKLNNKKPEKINQKSLQHTDSEASGLKESGSDNNFLHLPEVNSIPSAPPEIDPLDLRVLKHPEYQSLVAAVQVLLESPNQEDRKYYFVNSMKTVRTYSDFTSFGELALLTNKHRKAKLETLEDTHFAVLSKADYRQAQFRVQNQMLKDKTDFLKNFSIFASLSDSNLTSLSYCMIEEHFNRGQFVYREGIDSVEKIYLVKSGEFELTKQLFKPLEPKKVLLDNNAEY